MLEGKEKAREMTEKAQTLKRKKVRNLLVTVTDHNLTKAALK
jgi:hypothetical protein